VNGLFGSSALDVLALVVLAALLLAVLRGVGWLLRVLPLSRSRADLVERAWPVLAMVGVLAFVLFAAHVLLGPAPGVGPFAGVVVLGLLVALSWWALRDTVSGVFLRAGRACRRGDFVRIGDVEGRVERMGWRAMVVVTHSGNEAILPYSRAARESIVRTPEQAQASPHVFAIPVPTDRQVGAVKQTVRRAALLSHWSSVVREPELALRGEDTLEVTVFALDAERGYEIEAAVRRALKNGSDGTRPRASGSPRRESPSRRSRM